MDILKGVRILDFTRVLSGPFATMILGDMGAEIIKVERPLSGDDSRKYGPFINGESAFFMSINRNKKSVTVDLKNPDGKKIIQDLIKKSDVLVENFRPGVMDGLEFGYEKATILNPRLIYAAISGFGRTGPLSTLAAYDGVVQAMSGIMSITGEKGGKPVRVGSSIGDIISGIYCALGVMAALYEREHTGKGSLIDIAMLDSLASILENAIARYQTTGSDPIPLGNAHPSIFPFETFPTASSEEIMIAVGNDAIWGQFCEAIGRKELAVDALLLTNPLRGENHDYMYRELCDALSKRSADEWYKLLSDEGVPCSLINRISQVINNPQLVSRNMIQTVEHQKAGTITVTGNPIKKGGGEEYTYKPAPILGADTEATLESVLGISKDSIKQLRRDGVI